MLFKHEKINVQNILDYFKFETTIQELVMVYQISHRKRSRLVMHEHDDELRTIIDGQKTHGTH
jgi:hypothetical protein